MTFWNTNMPSTLPSGLETAYSPVMVMNVGKAGRSPRGVLGVIAPGDRCSARKVMGTECQ